MRAFVPLLLLAVAPAHAQRPVTLDARCAGHSEPSHPSYTPPPWLGDSSPAYSSAAAAQRDVRRFRRQLLAQPPGPGWVAAMERLASAERDQCLLSDEERACRFALYDYMTLFNLSVQQATPPSRPDQVSFRLSMLYQRRGELDAAQRHLHYMLKELPPGPLRPSALILLGQTHEREGELAEARRFYERAARTASSERGLALYLATWAAKTAGDAAAASSLAERALGAATGLLRDAVRRDWCALHVDR